MFFPPPLFLQGQEGEFGMKQRICVIMIHVDAVLLDFPIYMFLAMHFM